MTANVLLHLAGALVGAEIREAVREVARMPGVVRVRPGAKLPRLLLIDYDPAAIAPQAIVAAARHRWGGAQLVGM